MTTISVIGSAGRQADSSLVTANKWQWMFDQLKKEIKKIEGPITLVSGGAAFSDHLAVRYWLEFDKINIKLCLPCRWDPSKTQFLDNGSSDWRVNPGKTANYYHHQFSEAVDIDSLAQLGTVHRFQKPPEICFLDHYKGFHDRNSVVANSDYIIAFTNSSTGSPKDGGTADTYNKAKTINKIHIDIG